MSRWQQRYQQGDAMVVIMIVLGVALIGALAFLAWQNYLKPTDMATDTPLQTNQQAEQPQENMLAFSDWKVEMPMTDDMGKLTVVKLPELEGYAVKVPETTLFDGAARGDVTQEVGRVVRVAASTPGSEVMMGSGTGKTARQLVESGDLSNGVIVGEYVYIYSTRQATAYDGATSAEVAADKKLETLSTKTFPNQFKKLQAVK